MSCDFSFEALPPSELLFIVRKDLKSTGVNQQLINQRSKWNFGFYLRDAPIKMVQEKPAEEPAVKDFLFQ